MMDKRDLLFKLTSQQFAAFETKLFLDTHPYDMAAKRMYDGYMKAYMDLLKKYESLYGPLTAENAAGRDWMWISDPWPWEREAN